jgi:hypothetical protein
MTPRYFFANATETDFADDAGRVRPEFLATYALAWAWRDITHKDQVSCFQHAHGPGDQPGLFVWIHPGKDLRYRPGRQHWHECQAAPPPLTRENTTLPRTVWLGIDEGQSVKPDDLAREQLTAGYKVELYEELGPLIVPVIRSPRRDRVNIPQRMHFDAAGNVVLTVREQWQWLWEGVGRAWDVLTGNGEAFGYAEGLQLALDVLGVNYRYSRYEQELLAWLDTSNWLDVLYTATDVALVRELLTAEGDKKKAVPELAVVAASPEPGLPADSPSIAPAAAISTLPASATADGEGPDDEAPLRRAWNDRHKQRAEASA